MYKVCWEKYIAQVGGKKDEENRECGPPGWSSVSEFRGVSWLGDKEREGRDLNQEALVQTSGG